MTFGHLALASIGRDTLFKDINFYFLAMAAFGPDLADKPMRLFFGLNGRGLGHTLIVYLVVLTVGWLLCRRKIISSKMFLAGAILWLSHLAADFLDSRIFFWPFLGPLPLEEKFGFWEMIYYWLHFYNKWRWANLQFCLEFTCIVLAVVLWMQRRTGWNPVRIFRQRGQHM